MQPVLVLVVAKPPALLASGFALLAATPFSAGQRRGPTIHSSGPPSAAAEFKR
jgi:hypothetical protein